MAVITGCCLIPPLPLAAGKTGSKHNGQAKDLLLPNGIGERKKNRQPYQSYDIWQYSSIANVSSPYKHNDELTLSCLSICYLYSSTEIDKTE